MRDVDPTASTETERDCWETLQEELPEAPDPTDPRTAGDALERTLSGMGTDGAMRELVDGALAQAEESNRDRYTFDVEVAYGTGRLSLTERGVHWYLQSATVPRAPDACAPAD